MKLSVNSLTNQDFEILEEHPSESSAQRKSHTKISIVLFVVCWAFHTPLLASKFLLNYSC